jgi:hypothetical protein
VDSAALSTNTASNCSLAIVSVLILLGLVWSWCDSSTADNHWTCLVCVIVELVGEVPGGNSCEMIHVKYNHHISYESIQHVKWRIITNVNCLSYDFTVGGIYILGSSSFQKGLRPFHINPVISLLAALSLLLVSFSKFNAYLSYIRSYNECWMHIFRTVHKII